MAVLHQLGLNSANSQLYSRFHLFIFLFIFNFLIFFPFSENAVVLGLASAESFSIKPALLEAVALKLLINLSTNSVEG